VVAVLSAAAKKASESDEYKKRMEELGFEAQYLGPEQFARVWAESEERIKPLMELMKR
jgi:tripartite-type tricarboxylate transporter receptor subunit TctC